MNQLKIEYISPDELIPYSGNAKMHPPDQVDHIANSIKAFGWKQPIVCDHDKVVIIGHGRLMAAKQLMLDNVPVVFADDLTPEQVDALRLADNKTNESEWDFDSLEKELAALDIAGIDMEQFGFLQEEEENKNDGSGGNKPEVKFSEILGEANNYLILQFKNEIDWLNACTVFEIKNAKSYSTRKDGIVTKSMERIGTARVLDGAEALRKLVSDV